MRVRSAQASDVAILREIVDRAYGIYIERLGRRPAPMDDDYDEKVHHGHVFVVECQTAVASLIVLVPASDNLLIENVAVDPRHQGTGIGHTLLAYAEMYATERQILELRLYTNTAMTENVAWYRRLGYREYDRRTENGLSRVFFCKTLNAPGAPPPT